MTDIKQINESAETMLKNLLEQLAPLLPSLASTGALARLGDNLTGWMKDAGHFLGERLVTDANWAAAAGELARTAAYRRTSLNRLDADFQRAQDDLAAQGGQIANATVALSRLLGLVDEYVSEEHRGEAKAALRGVLNELGAHVVVVGGAAEGEPPVDTHRGIAECDKGHTWPCVWFVKTEPTDATFGMPPSVTTSTRVVFPPACPNCGGKWTAINDEPEPEEQPS